MKTKKAVKNGKKTIERNYSPPKNITLIGAGAWGTSIAKTIAEMHPDCLLKIWAYEKEVARSINEEHVNNLYLPGIKLPSNITSVTDLKNAVPDSEVIIFATPSKVLYDISLRVKKYITKDVYVGYLTKGFIRVHNKIVTISQALEKVFPGHKNSIAAIYGPSHAEEVSVGYHTCLNIASVSAETRKVFVDLMNCDYLACRETDDILGVDLGSTLKNPAAIAAGILSVLPKCGDNLAGALISEALSEMMKLGKAFGAREETIMGIAGLGDLVATALSDHSRNRRFGRDIGNQIQSSGVSFSILDRIIMIIKPEFGFEKISESIDYLAEGIYVIEPILELAKKYKVSMPVYRSLYEILLNKKDPRLLIETVKNPANFNEVFKQTRIYVTEKKKGLENKRGAIFRKAIIQNSVENLVSNPGFEAELSKFKTLFLKDFEESIRKKGYDSDFLKKEYEILTVLQKENFEKGLSQLCKLYTKDISDNFNSVVYKIVIKIIKLLNFFNMFVPKNQGNILENNIKITGNRNSIKEINGKSNVVYLSTYKSYLDFTYIIMAIDQFGIYIPRFFIDKKIIDSRIKQYLLRIVGGYFIDSKRLANPVYREVAQNYLSTLVEHGVNILFFPELDISRDGKIGQINSEFITRIMGSLYKNTEEIAMVPIELSYFKKPHAADSDSADNLLTIKNIIDSRIEINFSEPILASEYSNSTNIVALIAENIEKKWKSDAHIFPHYLFCRLLKENDYQLNMDDANSKVLSFLQKYNYNGKHKPKQILKAGADFIVQNGFGNMNEGALLVNKKEEVDYYSNLIYD